MKAQTLQDFRNAGGRVSFDFDFVSLVLYKIRFFKFQLSIPISNSKNTQL